jgi:hypothetical protein
MERKNDALGRTFTETKFKPKMGKNKEGKEVVIGFERVPVPSAERVYTIAGRYTRALTNEELGQVSHNIQRMNTPLDRMIEESHKATRRPVESTGGKKSAKRKRAA